MTDAKTIREFLDGMEGDWDGHIRIYEHGRILFFSKGGKAIPDILLDSELTGINVSGYDYDGQRVKLAEFDIKLPWNRVETMESREFDPPVELEEALDIIKSRAERKCHVVIRRNGANIYLGTSLALVPEWTCEKNVRGYQMLKTRDINMEARDLAVMELS